MQRYPFWIGLILFLILVNFGQHFSEMVNKLLFVSIAIMFTLNFIDTTKFLNKSLREFFKNLKS
ncbi:hypothetical protein B0182_06315 [Moraxella bovis]|uniref:Uncharacterized protein n=1 Tax=Moraxella bovis TaxID=476 RepID=A0A1T0A2L9_MORBO|nr:hypothetical protein DQF64_11935 [Moraxella bovis]OOR90006.1 hypothetical protein B0182_06315 [Moraxella bovis]STY91154.1 Uncharacterised protein [Moraxella bovis]